MLHEHKALGIFTENITKELKIILLDTGKTDECSIKRALWRTCVYAQKVIYMFYIFIDKTVKSQHLTENDVLKTLQVFLFLTRRSRQHYVNGLDDITKTVKDVYLENATRRVPLELVDPNEAMRAKYETWLDVPNKSYERIPYILATTRETATRFFFP